MKEEIFGPVVNINTFKTEAEAIAKANDSEFGLYAAVYTKDINRAMRFAKALESIARVGREGFGYLRVVKPPLLLLIALKNPLLSKPCPLWYGSRIGAA